MPEMIKSFPFTDDGAKALPSVICLGNFDGVHLGHLTLFRQVSDFKQEMFHAGQNIKSGALCFDTLSSAYFSTSEISHLMTLEKKLERFKDMGLDCAYVCNFSDIKDMTPVDFIEEILIKKCNCIGVVCGFNFKFGKNAAGNAEFLVDYFSKKDIGKTVCCIVPPVKINGTIISSSLIRDLLSRGDIETANAMLGYDFSISHSVVHGKHIGTSLGFPTLNHIFSDKEIRPALGIYATKTSIGGEMFTSVTNIGVRPTVSNSDVVTCETHLIGVDHNQSFYGENAEVFFYTKIRDEKKFDSHAQLSAAIATDIQTVKNYFNSK